MFMSYLWMDVSLCLAVNLVLWAWVWFVPARVLHVDRLPRDAHGLALPGLILLQEGAGQFVLVHELVHVRQMRRWSPPGVACLLGWHHGVRPGIHRLRTGSRPSFPESWRTCPLEQEACGPLAQAKRLLPIWASSR